LLKPRRLREDFKAAFVPMVFEAVRHKKQICGYPLALEWADLRKSAIDFELAPVPSSETEFRKFSADWK
jgi:hypothetical protein